VLKLLIARPGRPVTREAIGEVLWPGEPVPAVSNRLSVALSVLRSVLDPGREFPTDHFVRADKESVAVGDLEVDVLTFLKRARDGLRHLAAGDVAEARIVLAEAQTAYTGDFLAEDPYADWALPLREEARAQYLRITRALADLAAGAGDTDDAVAYLLRLLEHDPYDEDAHRRLAAALRAAGRHGEARRRYRMYASRMAELGVDPAPYDEAP
jgi:DNA-binding SARP family transcriptional activator